MRYFILGDIHSNLEALEAVIAASKNEQIDQYLCIGDVVGYAANPKECIAKLKLLGAIVVAGNHDWASVDLFSKEYFNPQALEAVFWTRRNLDDECKNFLETLKLTFENRDLTLVHGTLDSPQDFNYLTDGYIAEETFRRMKPNICFLGHTHTAGIFIKDNQERIHYRQDSAWDINLNEKYIINVGSVGQPRDGNPQAAYCIYDTAKSTVEIKRIDYDTETTRKKIIDVGLPKFLGDRLLLGR
jgi:predicted phosphodiesterase